MPRVSVGGGRGREEGAGGEGEHLDVEVTRGPGYMLNVITTSSAFQPILGIVGENAPFADVEVVSW